MAGRLPQSFIDDLIARIDIVDLINARVPLKKTGKNYSACCPFHTEKTPSFSVNREKQFYYCFGCGAGGNAISFLMDYDRLSFIDVIEELAATLGVEVPRSESGDSDKPRFDHLYPIQKEVAGFYQKQLRLPAGQKAVDYLKSRGVSGEIARRYALGFAPEGWNNLPRHLKTEELVEVGLLIKKQPGKHYDRFRNRVMFPIRDRRGRVIGFGGRVLDDSTPKYLNSPESPVFHKGREVYGLYELLQSPGTPGRILLVEGYMDVIALAQFGVDYAVACLGTAASTEHCQLLFRYTSELVFCFDGDKAGRKAAWRAVESALPVLRDGCQVRIMLLSQGDDPDSLVRRIGVDGFVDQVENSVPLSDFFFEQLTLGLHLDEVEGRSRLAEVAAPLLNKLPPGVFRDLMQSKLSQVAGVVRAEKEVSEQVRPARLVKGRKETFQLSASRIAIILLLQNPQLVSLCDEHYVNRFDKAEEPGVVFLMRVRSLILANPGITPGGMMEYFRNTKDEQLVRRLLAWELLVPSAGIEQEFVGALQRLYRLVCGNRLEQLVQQASRPQGVTESEREEMRELLQLARQNS